MARTDLRAKREIVGILLDTIFNVSMEYRIMTLDGASLGTQTVPEVPEQAIP